MENDPLLIEQGPESAEELDLVTAQELARLFRGAYADYICDVSAGKLSISEHKRLLEQLGVFGSSYLARVDRDDGTFKFLKGSFTAAELTETATAEIYDDIPSRYTLALVGKFTTPQGRELAHAFSMKDLGYAKVLLFKTPPAE